MGRTSKGDILQSLDLGSTRVTDEGLKYIKGLTTLQSLDLGCTRVADEGLKYIKGLTRLQSLNWRQPR